MARVTPSYRVSNTEQPVVTQNGKNAMHWAAESGHLSTLKILCDHFAVWTDSDKVRLVRMVAHVDPVLF